MTPCVFLSLCHSLCVERLSGWLSVTPAETQHCCPVLCCVKLEEICPPSCDTFAVGLVFMNTKVKRALVQHMRVFSAHLRSFCTTAQNLSCLIERAGYTHTHACLTTCLHKYLISQSHGNNTVHRGMKAW